MSGTTTPQGGPQPAAPATPAGARGLGTLHVLFTLGKALYAVPGAAVLHMESYEGATPVPGAPPYVAGLVQSRRRVVPVVDVRLRFGLPPEAPTLQSRVIVVQAGERAVALLVDSAREVAHIPPEAFGPPPEMVERQAAGYVRAVAQHKERLVMLIDIPKVIGEEAAPHAHP
jgi:purine-binding chemotaxis protein CheW